MSSGGGGSETTRIRYADYIESAHSSNIRLSQRWNDVLRNTSPYNDFTNISFSDALYSAGYSMRNYPSINSLFKTFVYNLDVVNLFDTVFNQVVNAGTIKRLVNAHSTLLDDEIEQTTLPRFKAGMRDIGAVMTSSYVIGSAIVEQGKIKALSKYKAELEHSLTALSVNVFNSILGWKQEAVRTFLDIVKCETALHIDQTKLNYEIKVKDVLWPFTVMQNDQAIIGSLQGSMKHTTDKAGISTTSSVAGGAMTGAAAGTMIAGPGWGTVLGGVAGGLAGLLG